jgi:hypothetical protein
MARRFAVKGGIVLAGALACCLLVSNTGVAQSAGPQGSARLLKQTLRQPKGSISITVGGIAPLSHASLTEFWNPGLVASVGLYVHLQPAVAVGLGIEGGFLQFDTGAFQAKYPTVPVRYADLGYLHLSVRWRYTLVPAARLTPYFLADVGAAKVSHAIYQETVAGKRVTYYEIPGRTRLAVGGGIGCAYIMSRALLLEAEVNGLYMHNDPEAGLLVAARLGVRFNLF